MQAWVTTNAPNVGNIYEMPGTAMSLAPPTVAAAGTPATKIEAWGGFAFNAITSTFYSAANGGHTDYAGNEVNLIAVDVASPAWTEDLAGTAAGNVIDTADHYLDGRPISRHGQYSPWFDNHGGDSRVLLFGGGARYSLGATTIVQATDAYDTASKTWSALATMTGQLAGFENPMICRDERNGNVYVAGGPSQWVMQKWTKATNAWSEVRSAATTELIFAAVRTASAWDSVRNRIFMLGGSNAVHHVYTPDTNTDAAITLSGPAAVAVGALFDAGLCYVPDGDFFIARDGGDSGGLFYKITPTGVCTVFATTGGAAIPVPVANQIYNRIAYVPALLGCVMFPTYAGNGWFLRVAPLPVPVITTQPEGESAPVGGTATFTVVDSGTVSWQWQVSADLGETWANVSSGTGGTTATYTTAAITAGDNGKRYRVVLTNANGTTTSEPAWFFVTGLSSAGKGLRMRSAWTRKFARNGSASMLPRSRIDFGDVDKTDGLTWSAWLYPAVASNAADLAGAATGSGSSSGALAKAAALAATAIAQASATAALAKTLGLAGNAAGQAAAAAALAKAVALAADAVGAAAVTAALSTSGGVTLLGAAVGTSVATGDLAHGVPLQAAAAGTGVAAADLAHGVPLQGSAAGGGTASASMAHSVSLQAAAAGIATGTGSLALSIALSATAIAAALASGALGVTSGVVLDGAAQGQGTGAGALNVGKPLAVAALGQGNSAASLTLVLQLSAAAIGRGLSTAALDVTGGGVVTLAGAGQGAGAGTGALNVGKPLAGAAAGAGQAGATLMLTVPLSGAAIAQVQAGGTLALNVLLDAAALGRGQAGGALNVAVQVQLSGAAVGQASATGSLSLGEISTATSRRRVQAPALRRRVVAHALARAVPA